MNKEPANGAWEPTARRHLHRAVRNERAGDQRTLAR